jgi:hypothetical protein
VLAGYQALLRTRQITRAAPSTSEMKTNIDVFPFVSFVTENFGLMEVPSSALEKK